MPLEMNRLTIPAIRAAKSKGLYADGGGLYLQVSKWGTKAWIFRYTLKGKSRQMGLGSLNTVSLKAAREEAQRCRILLREGFDPIEARDTEKALKRIDAAKSMSFRACAEAYIHAHQPSWRNVKHGTQWRSTLATYVYPIFGDLPASAVDTGLVVQVIEPIWATKTETASRVRGRVEVILDWAKVRGYRDGENPARWRGHLDMLLPSRNKVRKVRHHAALPYDQIPSFMEVLPQQEGTSAAALSFLIMTASRTSEALGARWDEVDIKKGIWIISGDRMKSGKEHRVPLSVPAIKTIRSMKEVKQSVYVFPGARGERSLSNMALLQLLKRMRYYDLTVHGFRSSFRDWAAERTAYPSEVAEMALAHAVSDKVEAAYRRGDLFEKRRRLMDDWAAYCMTPNTNSVDDKIVALRST